jgi:hypothetical protein
LTAATATTTATTTAIAAWRFDLVAIIIARGQALKRGLHRRRVDESNPKGARDEP